MNNTITQTKETISNMYIYCESKDNNKDKEENFHDTNPTFTVMNIIRRNAPDVDFAG